LFFASANPNQLTRELIVEPIFVAVYHFVRTRRAYTLKTFSFPANFGRRFILCAAWRASKQPDAHADSVKSEPTNGVELVFSLDRWFYDDMRQG
jgi:hypothetical protein